jgi:diamine N-acetyltransferase
MLRVITPENRAVVEALRVTPEQELFVAGVAESLVEAAESPDAHPWYRAVYRAETPVGFVMLSDGDSSFPWPYFLWRFLIDRRFQGQGYGRAALDAVVAYVRGRPGAEALYTSVGMGEGSPLGFYERYGFRRTGETLQDEVVLRYVLST